MSKNRKDLFIEVVNPVPIELNVEELLQTLNFRRLRKDEANPLLEKCRQLIEPRAVYTFLKVKSIERDEARLESGHTLKSIIIADMLECEQTIAPYVVTIGPRLELQASVDAKTSILRGWIMEKIGDYSLRKASAYIRSRVKEKLGSKVSSFGPGTGTGKLFDIKQQEILFQILDPGRRIEVHLTPSYLMVPRKSVSGVFAVARREYVACQYCPREKCENRRRPFSGEYYSLNCENKVPIS